jgi:hypothetical protein
MVASLNFGSGALHGFVGDNTADTSSDVPPKFTPPASPPRLAAGGSPVPSPRVNAVVGRVLGALDEAAGAGVAPRALPAVPLASPARGPVLQLLQDDTQPTLLPRNLLPSDDAPPRTLPQTPTEVEQAIRRFDALQPQAFRGLTESQNAYARGALVMLINAVLDNELSAADVPAALQRIAAGARAHGQPEATSAAVTTSLAPPRRDERSPEATQITDALRRASVAASWLEQGTSIQTVRAELRQAVEAAPAGSPLKREAQLTMALFDSKVLQQQLAQRGPATPAEQAAWAEWASQ